ncbi:MAG TPA: hypothetical protein VID73_07010, partial [Ktedonobacterales bacterium]
MPSARNSTPAAPPGSAASGALVRRRAMRWPFWMGGVVTLVAFALLVADARPTLVRTWETLLRDPGQVGLGATL